MSAKYKRKWLTFWFLTIAPITVIILLNFYHDPLHRFFPPKSKILFSTNERLEVPQILNLETPSEIIIGTSSTKGITETDLKEVLNAENPLNLSMGAATQFEQRRIIDLAYAQHKVKKVYWGLGWIALNTNPAATRVGIFPDYLYDKGVISDLKYLSNLDTTKIALEKLIWDGDLKTFLPTRRIKSQPSTNTKNERLIKFAQNLPFDLFYYRRSFFSIDVDIETLEKNFQQNLVEVLEQYPDVEFNLLIMPTHLIRRLFYQKEKPQHLQLWNSYKKKISLLSKLPNVKVFDFDSVETEITKSSEFQDVHHFTNEMSKDLLLMIKNNDNILHSKLDMSKYSECLNNDVYDEINKHVFNHGMDRNKDLINPKIDIPITYKCLSLIDQSL